MGNIESKKHNAVTPDSKHGTKGDIFHDHNAINEQIKAINRIILNPETQIGFFKIMISEGLSEYKLLQEVQLAIKLPFITITESVFVIFSLGTGP